jgi:hypothetical protein
MNIVVTSSNSRAVIGGNNPPEDTEPTPFERSKNEIDGLFLEAKNWADGSPVENQAQADAIAKLRDLIRDAEKVADGRRIEENKPFDDGKAEVQARYADLIANTKSKKGKTVLAMEALNKALAPYLCKLDDEKQAKAKAAREEADRLAKEAYEALRAAKKGDDLEAVEQAEIFVQEANAAEAAASRAENAKAHAKGTGRAVGLRTVYRGEITNLTEFARHVWKVHPLDFAESMAALCAQLVARGVRTIPGAIVHEDKVL